MRRIFIYHNKSCATQEALQKLNSAFIQRGFSISDTFDGGVEIILCVGGDGTLLRLLPDLDYPQTPIVGVNTGHMGFFQEFDADRVEELAEICRDRRYEVQEHRLIQASVFRGSEKIDEYCAINDILIRSNVSRLTHLYIDIGSTFIEHFSGDGVVISTPVGSTAYNYSVGGAIVDPRISLLQLSPIAPMNAVAFRSFTSSFILPPDLDVRVRPDPGFNQHIIVSPDGFEHHYDDISEIRVGFDGKSVWIARSEGFDFWAKVSSKFL